MGYTRPETAKRLNRARYLRRKHFLTGVKLGSGCIDCSESDPVVLEFDHVRGQKIHNVGVISSWPRMIDELEKCDVVCCNCHARRTYQGVLG